MCAADLGVSQTVFTEGSHSYREKCVNNTPSNTGHWLGGRGRKVCESVNDRVFLHQTRRMREGGEGVDVREKGIEEKVAEVNHTLSLLKNDDCSRDDR